MGGIKKRKADKRLEARIKGWEVSTSGSRGKDQGIRADSSNFHKPGSKKK